MALVTLSSPSAHRAGPWQQVRAAWANLIQRLELGSWQREVQAQEAYLAQAVDAEDFDRRMRQLGRIERTRFIGYF